MRMDKRRRYKNPERERERDSYTFVTKPTKHESNICVRFTTHKHACLISSIILNFTTCRWRLTRPWHITYNKHISTRMHKRCCVRVCLKMCLAVAAHDLCDGRKHVDPTCTVHRAKQGRKRLIKRSADECHAHSPTNSPWSQQHNEHADVAAWTLRENYYLMSVQRIWQTDRQDSEYAVRMASQFCFVQTRRKKIRSKCKIEHSI